MTAIAIKPIKPIPHLRHRHLGGHKFVGVDGGKFAVEVSANPKSGWQGISIECRSDERPDSHFYLHPEEAAALRDCLTAAINLAAAESAPIAA